MAQPGETAAGNRIEPEVALIVYRRADGEIVATHYFGTAQGGVLPPEAELRSTALANAVGEGLGEEGLLAVLPVDPARLERGIAWRVRPDTGELEALPPAEDRASAG